MSKVLKWILYVLLGLVVLAVIAGIFFAIFGVGHAFPMMRQGFRTVQPGFRMMQPYRYNYFYPGRAIFGGLFALGLFLLVVIGIIALISFLVRGNRPAQQPPAAQMAPLSPAPTPSPEPMPVSTRTCSNCGKPAQDDWKTCPYCGNPLS